MPGCTVCESDDDCLTCLEQYDSTNQKCICNSDVFMSEVTGICESK
jgi:hypothetical protein